MRYELPSPSSVRLWRQAANYNPNIPSSRPLCTVCKDPCTTLMQVCDNHHQPEPWGWKPVCSTCLRAKGHDWAKAYLWRLTISLPELAIDRALGIDAKGQTTASRERAAAARLADAAVAAGCAREVHGARAPIVPAPPPVRSFGDWVRRSLP